MTRRRIHHEDAQTVQGQVALEVIQGQRTIAHLAVWPGAGFTGTELGVMMEPEVKHGTPTI